MPEDSTTNSGEPTVPLWENPDNITFTNVDPTVTIGTLTLPQTLWIGDNVRIDLKTGEVTFPNGTPPSEAAQEFWKAVELLFHGRIE